MTTGQRIAQKRKEAGISQEALGEQLGVSRQSVYKWESGAALPEIDKLVAMSRLFGVTVGWLLGEEEPGSGEGAAAAESGELSEKQMKMVEEIAGRYIAALPKPPRRRRWLWIAAALAVILAGISLFSRLDRMDGQYNNLQNAVAAVRGDVNNQIYSITGRVEEILKHQNNLAAEYSAEILSADLAANTVTFQVRAVPKTYVEDMEATFLADNGEGLTETAGVLGDGREFSAEITCALTDSITLSVVFADGGKQETQLLDVYSGLYSGSFPYVEAWETSLQWTEVGEDGTLSWPEMYALIDKAALEHQKPGETPVAQVASVRVGFFRNRELVGWLEPCDWPKDRFVGESWAENQFYCLKDCSITTEPGDVFSIGAVVLDVFGREMVYESLPRYTVQDGELSAAGDAEVEAATGQSIEMWWEKPWVY